jgi:predicted nucleic acid-binding protein
VAFLKNIAAAEQKSMAELIRQSIDLLAKTKYNVKEKERRKRAMAAVKAFQEDIAPVLRIEWIDDKIHHAAMGIMIAASRKKLSLVDCVSFETMRLLGVKTAFTLDRHFKEQGFICIPA